MFSCLNHPTIPGLKRIGTNFNGFKDLNLKPHGLNLASSVLYVPCSFVCGSSIHSREHVSPLSSFAAIPFNFDSLRLSVIQFKFDLVLLSRPAGCALAAAEQVQAQGVPRCARKGALPRPSIRYTYTFPVHLSDARFFSVLLSDICTPPSSIYLIHTFPVHISDTQTFPVHPINTHTFPVHLFDTHTFSVHLSDTHALCGVRAPSAN